jgi:hypothetical protein
MKATMKAFETEGPAKPEMTRILTAEGNSQNKLGFVDCHGTGIGGVDYIEHGAMLTKCPNMVARSIGFDPGEVRPTWVDEILDGISALKRQMTRNVDNEKKEVRSDGRGETENSQEVCKKQHDNDNDKKGLTHISSEADGLTGCVMTRWRADKGFGFCETLEREKRLVFVHTTAMTMSPCVGRKYWVCMIPDPSRSPNSWRATQLLEAT